MSMELVPAPRRESPQRTWPPQIQHAAKVLIDHLAAQGITLPDPHTAAYLTGKAYAASMKRRQVGQITSDVTKTLAAMAVGQVRLFAFGQSRANLFARMKNARLLMNDPEAKWLIQTIPDDGGFSVTRLANGAKANAARSEITIGFSQMAVGEKVVLLDKRAENLSAYYVRARALSGDPMRKWEGKTIMRRGKKCAQITRVR